MFLGPAPSQAVELNDTEASLIILGEATRWLQRSPHLKGMSTSEISPAERTLGLSHFTPQGVLALILDLGVSLVSHCYREELGTRKDRRLIPVSPSLCASRGTSLTAAKPEGVGQRRAEWDGNTPSTCCCTSSVQLERLKDYGEACETLRVLLDSAPQTSRRGRWWLRLSTDQEHAGLVSEVREPCRCVKGDPIGEAENEGDHKHVGHTSLADPIPSCVYTMCTRLVPLSARGIDIHGRAWRPWLPHHIQ